MAEQTPPATKPENHHLVPPDAGLDQHKRKNLPFVLIVIITLFIILDLAVLVYWLRPEKESKAPTPQKVVQKKIPALPEPEPSAKDNVLTKTRLAAEEQLGRWLRLQARAEAENVAFWGDETYTRITALVTRGDKAFAKKDFTGARQAYKEAEKRLEILLAAKMELFAAAMDQGRAALQRQDSETATRYFELALTMDPDNAEAEHGRQRGGNLDQVILLQRQGLELEKKELFTEARSILLQATQLDPEFIPAAEILARVENKLSKKRFQQAMSAFFAALEKGNLSEARRSLQQATTFKPSDPVLKDAGKQLKSAELAARLTGLEKKFKQFAAAEQWQKTLQICQQALRINPQAGFAVQAKGTVKKRLALDQALVSVLARPERLQDDAPLTEAGQILKSARSIKNPGTRLTAQIASLDQLLARAGTEVEVILRSDEATEVIIYRVGRLGTFAQKQLKLRPGTYTIVGTRPGFRDVRHKLEVKAGRNLSLFIHCEEPI
ncbi:MAG: hypothetical protein U9P37_06495 [Pseudomonadota bacterium]|nr:hypothetical protein [Pseudomonadota bacterium]